MKLFKKLSLVAAMVSPAVVFADVPAAVTTAFTTAQADIATVSWGLAVVALIGMTIRIIRSKA